MFVFDPTDSSRPPVTVVLACLRNTKVEGFFALPVGGQEKAALDLAVEQGFITGKSGPVQPLNSPDGSIVLVVPMGNAKQVTATTLRSAAGKACSYLRNHKALEGNAAFWVARHTHTIHGVTYCMAELCSLLAEGWGLRNHSISSGEAAERNVAVATYTGEGITEEGGYLPAAIRMAELRVQISKWVRDTGNLRANGTNAINLAERASALLGDLEGVTAQILRDDFFDGTGENNAGPHFPHNERRMGSFLSVNAGSDNPPAGIIAQYRCGVPGALRVCLNGKGVWFDNGGEQNKGGVHMYEMHLDKMGSMTMLALFKYLVQIGVEIDLVVMCLFTDNGKECQPGDVVTARNGQEIEVFHTDAEGRLCLIDATDYLVEHYTPHYVLTAATLTGAVCEALGGRVGMFTSNREDELMPELAAAIRPSDISFWPCPVAYEHAATLKSAVADMMNSGTNGRKNGHGVAAYFLVSNLLASNKLHGTDEAPQETTLWHFDIAGMMKVGSPKGHQLPEADPDPFLAMAWALPTLVKDECSWIPQP